MDFTNPGFLQFIIFSSAQGGGASLFTCSAIPAAVAGAQDFLAGFLRWCEASSIDVKEAELNMNVSLDVDANDRRRAVVLLGLVRT